MPNHMLKRGNTDPIPSTYRLRLLACHAAIVRTNALLAQVILVRKVLGGFSHFEIIFTPGRTYHLFELRIVGPFSSICRLGFNRATLGYSAHAHVQTRSKSSRRIAYCREVSTCKPCCVHGSDMIIAHPHLYPDQPRVVRGSSVRGISHSGFHCCSASPRCAIPSLINAVPFHLAPL